MLIHPRNAETVGLPGPWDAEQHALENGHPHRHRELDLAGNSLR